MFWESQSGYTQSANIEALLNKENTTLKELLDDEDILQECKSQNHTLLKFLNRAEIIDELVTLIVKEPSNDVEENIRYLYPNIACEILTSDVPSIKTRLVEDPLIIGKLYGFFEQEPPLNPLLTSFVCKTFGTLIMKKGEMDWFLYQTICLQVLEFIKSKDNFLESILQHFSTPVVMDLLLNMLNEIEDPIMKNNFLEWINEKQLIEKMIGVLKSPNEADKHNNIAQFLVEMIKTGRCNRQNDSELQVDRKSISNPLLQALEDENTSKLLLETILCESCTESSILSGIQILLCLLENPIIQEPVSQSALQQMIDTEKQHHDNIVSSLMIIIQPRIQELHELLLNPPVKTDFVTTTTLSPYLGIVRLQLCYLFTVLIETENTTIIEEICKTNFFNTSLNLFKQYCWNNFLHNYVKKCLIYAIQSFDTIPNDTKLVISALQKHIIVECNVAVKLMDCWNHNEQSQQVLLRRRLGYMGHLIDIMGALESTNSASNEFRALVESSLLIQSDEIVGDGETIDAKDKIKEQWHSVIGKSEIEIAVQKRFLANCDPSEKLDYANDSSSFPSFPDPSENDAEDFDYNFNASMHNTVNALMVMTFPDEYNDQNSSDSSSKMFEEACSHANMNADFDNNIWDNSTTNIDYPFHYNTNLNHKSDTSPFDEDADDENVVRLSHKQNGPITSLNENDDVFHGSDESNDGFNTSIDNFADFDKHFTNSTTPTSVTSDEEVQNKEETIMKQATDVTEVSIDEMVTSKMPHMSIFDTLSTNDCFVSTTQLIEISTNPPPPIEQPLKREFQLSNEIKAVPFDDLDEDEFFSLRDDSNELNSLTEDNDKKTLDIPDDDEFESADESSSNRNSEEDSNSNGDQFVDCHSPPATDAKIETNENVFTVNGDDGSLDANPKLKPSKLNLAQKTDQHKESTSAESITAKPFENGSS
ncbi:unnamed protein product [Diamesa serratosioi]